VKGQNHEESHSFLRLSQYCGHNISVQIVDNKEPLKTTVNKRKIRILPIIILLIIIGLLGTRFNLPQKLLGLNVQKVISDASKKNSLIATYEKNKVFDRNTDYGGFYDEMLSPSEKMSITKNEFINKYIGEKKSVSVNYTVHSIEVRGDRGIIDRTRIACYTTTCVGEDRSESRSKMEYIFINGKWYTSLNSPVLCDRDTEYIYPDEFKRALSLILQRKEQSRFVDSKDNADNYKKIKNCLDIQYATSDTQLSGAEGYFTFNRNSTPDRLEIIISTKYRVKDDLLTALLLVHELHHAFLHASGIDKMINCFENEAEAFTQELGLFEFDFNSEEQNSILNRYGTSQEIGNFLTLRQSMLWARGDSIFDKILPIIKSGPFYQKECNQNN
jgi:hypothetical protein